MNPHKKRLSIHQRQAIGPVLSVVVCFVTAVALAQTSQTPASSLTGRSIKAVGYRVGGGSTMVDLQSTGLIGQANGEAKVQAKTSVTTVEATVQGLKPATQLGTEFLTYVLWVVSPEGRAINLGEIQTDAKGRGKLKATTQLQSFSLLITAEPYATVRQPSEMLVLENAIRDNTKGRFFIVEDYKLMKRSQYEKLGNPLALSLDLDKVPLEMYEARNSVEIARSRGAGKYAPEIFSKAEAGLQLAENALARKANKKDIISLARQTTQSSEDARALSVERQEQERIENERLAASASAKAQAEAKAAEEAQRQAELAAAREAKAKAEAQRQAELAAARQAQAELAAAREAQVKAEAQRQAELAAAREAQLKAEAAAEQARAEIAASKAKAEADALKAKEQAAQADAERARQAAEQLRSQLLDQFNRILATRDTPRGLVITMADVLFDTGKYDLRMGTREQLAKLSGIVLAHPGLRLEVEGHTDSTGSDEFNQKLSEQRAEAVEEYLVKQGLSSGSVTAKGFGKSMPVSDNETAAGRQKNRRVEIIVSGEVIGVSIGK
jgi:outer membrane protein OmpA-like peptidoglycan-associated protein